MKLRLFILQCVCAWLAITLTFGCFPRGTSRDRSPSATNVDAQVRPPPLPDARQEHCDQHIECAKGMFCRDRGDNVKLCMGGGGLGDHCADTLDCSEPLFCRRYRRRWRLCM